MPASLILVELAMLIVVLDLFAGWLQPETAFPRRLTHALTEPPQALLRRLLQRLPTAGWDLSPAALLLLLGALRVWMIRP